MFTPFSINLRGGLREFDTPAVMGIVNVTPDSFYAASRHSGVDEVRACVEAMVDQGVDIIDIGAVSTRQGSQPPSVDDELRRLEHGIEAVRSVAPDVPVSVDTYRAQVAATAVGSLGADIINDVSGGTLDDKMFDVVADLGVPYILTHTRGTPATMASLTDYPDGVAAEVGKWLAERLRTLRLMGVADVIVDLGFGYAKTVEQNYELLDAIDVLAPMLEAPMLVGLSRKSMVYKPLGIMSSEALNGTTALHTVALMRGASMLRVHDVAAARQAITLLNLLPSQHQSPLTDGIIWHTRRI